MKREFQKGEMKNAKKAGYHMRAKYANNKANTSNKMEFSKSEFHFSADGYNNAFTESFASPYGYTLRTPYENKLQNR